MIYTRKWGKTCLNTTNTHEKIVKPAYICVSQDVQGNNPKQNKTQPNQPTVGLIRLLRKWKGRISRLVSSTPELRTPTLYLAWPPLLFKTMQGL